MNAGRKPKSQRVLITERFRRVSWGRLYWKGRNWRMRRFESDDVCIVLNGAVAIHYKSLKAFIEQIEEVERENEL